MGHVALEDQSSNRTSVRSVVASGAGHPDAPEGRPIGLQIVRWRDPVHLGLRARLVRAWRQLTEKDTGDFDSVHVYMTPKEAAAVADDLNATVDNAVERGAN